MADKHEHKEISEIQGLLRIMLGDAKYDRLMEQVKAAKKK